MSSYVWPPQSGGGSGGGVTSLNSLTGDLTLVAGTGITITPLGSNITIAATGSGTVTSVGLADGSTTPIYSISGSPVTTSGTLTFTLASQVKNLVLAGPATGANAQPTFRAIVAADLPVGNLTDAGTDGITITSGTGAVIGSGTSIAQRVADTTHNGYLSSTDWNTFNNKQSALTIGNLTDVGTDGIVVTGGTGAVIGAGTSLAQHVADTTHNGYLSSTDWNTFNGKQAAGNYITALTGDITATGPGSVAATLATVNANVGSFGSSTAIPNFTVNGKGLLTAAGTNVVIAPAGTLTGTTLASNVVTSSLTSVGTLTSGTWSATTIAINKGGTGQTTAAAAFNALNPMTTTGDIIYESGTNVASRLAVGSAGTVLTVSGGIPAWVNPSAYSGGAFFASSQVTTDSSDITAATFTTFSNSPAFSITPSVTGTYKVYASVPVYDRGAAATSTNPSIRITNTSGGATLLEESQAYIDSFNATATGGSLYTQSVYTLTAGNTYVFDIQALSDGTHAIYMAGTFANFYMFCEGIVTGTGALSLANFGSTPNTQGASIAGSVLTLQPASATQPGGVSTTTQTMAGAKTFSSNVTLQGTGNAVGTITSGIWNGTCNGGTSFLTAGTTYTTPSNITTATQFKFTLIGGGGAGGGSTSVNQVGSGGGAGGSAIVYLTGLTASTAYTIALGSGGSGSSGATGGNGGNTTLLVNATTYTAAGGNGGVAAIRGAGGTGGSTTNATIGITGQTGSASQTSSVPSGLGGSTLLGFGGTPVAVPSTNQTTGNAGTGFGSGGGGSTSAGTGANAAGGAGTGGCILVEWTN